MENLYNPHIRKLLETLSVFKLMYARKLIVEDLLHHKLGVARDVIAIIHTYSSEKCNWCNEIFFEDEHMMFCWPCMNYYHQVCISGNHKWIFPALQMCQICQKETTVVRCYDYRIVNFISDNYCIYCEVQFPNGAQKHLALVAQKHLALACGK